MPITERLDTFEVVYKLYNRLSECLSDRNVNKHHQSISLKQKLFRMSQTSWLKQLLKIVEINYTVKFPMKVFLCSCGLKFLPNLLKMNRWLHQSTVGSTLSLGDNWITRMAKPEDLWIDLIWLGLHNPYAGWHQSMWLFSSLSYDLVFEEAIMATI